ncbi:M3 family metallopeptidase [Cyanobium sp. CH-040]|uniref:M3 family metallopeptidase n=1 Tax=Cyanobium sp. CH-040 TaxID=2823708 RepID=UPI0020CDA8DF|nr:M3 family metallopeptidase [Cyanobium sp. CH-040]MCP9926808.1 M3 family metallopeptidase [Cyanobium sp. CH-040]
MANASAPAQPPLLAGTGLPSFEEITPEQVDAAIPALLRDLHEELESLECRLEQRLGAADGNGPEPQPVIGWEELMDPLRHLEERLRWSWGVVSHLHGVCNSPALREAYQNQQGAVVAFGSRAGQSRPIYRALEQLERQHLDGTQRRILASELRHMRLRGVGLEGSEQEAFNAATAELAQLASDFGNHVLDATNKWSLKLTSEEELAGLPDSLRALLAQAARDAGDDGWRMGLDMPRVVPFLKYSRRRDLREAVYRAQVSRASGGDLDNRPLIERILSLRLEQARRLGYANWAEVSLASKMAESVAEVEQLLDDLRAAAYPVAQRELEELRACAARHGAPEAADLKPWDVAHWAEVLRKESFELDTEALRPWFPLEQVLQGLFGLCQRLFDIRIQATEPGEAPTWHPDVRYFRVHDGASGDLLAAFYLDPYSRPGSKRGGAWMDECLGRSRTPAGEPVLPVAYLICNQSPPVGDTPSLMTFEEVETLFHEFGHGLQHMLTTVDRPRAAGISNVEWDAVELPSQFMENWCYERTTLMGMARHWQSGEPLPEAEYQKLLAARTFMGGTATLRQVHFALTDLRLHSRWTPECGQTPEQLRREVARTTTVLEPIPEDAFLCSFSHIFAGGYSAGYYSYKWAEVLSADAFSAFEEVGLDDEEQVVATGRRFRDTVLSLGGSRSPAEVFEAFRGRPPSPEALIRHSGLTAV